VTNLRLQLLSESDAIRFCVCALRLAFSLNKSYKTLFIEFVSAVYLVSKKPARSQLVLCCSDVIRLSGRTPQVDYHTIAVRNFNVVMLHFIIVVVLVVVLHELGLGRSVLASSNSLF